MARVRSRGLSGLLKKRQERKTDSGLHPAGRARPEPDRRAMNSLEPTSDNNGETLLPGPTIKQRQITLFRYDRRRRRQISWAFGINVTGIFESIQATELTAHLRLFMAVSRR